MCICASIVRKDNKKQNSVVYLLICETLVFNDHMIDSTREMEFRNKSSKPEEEKWSEQVKDEFMHTENEQSMNILNEVNEILTIVNVKNKLTIERFTKLVR